MHTGTRSRPALGTAVFRPPRALGVIIGLGFTSWAAVVCVIALVVAAGAAPEFKTFVSWVVAGIAGALAILFANWTYAVWSLRYVVTPDAIVIQWGFQRVVVPLDTVQRMIPGRVIDEPQVHGLNWWGCHVGSADVPRIGYTLVYSTHNVPHELVYLVTTQESYALTVIDQPAFVEAVQSRAVIGSDFEHQQRSAATGIAAIPFWRDRVAIVAAAAMVLSGLALCGYVFARYPDLPPIVELNFPELGGVVRVGPKDELLGIAYLGAGILAVNLVAGVALHSWERAAGLWVLVSGSLLQGVLLTAAVVALETT